MQQSNTLHLENSKQLKLAKLYKMVSDESSKLKTALNTNSSYNGKTSTGGTAKDTANRLTTSSFSASLLSSATTTVSGNSSIGSGSSTSRVSNDKKRKYTTTMVSLLRFVRLIWNIYTNLQFDDTKLDDIVCKNSIASYIDDDIFENSNGNGTGTITSTTTSKLMKISETLDDDTSSNNTVDDDDKDRNGDDITMADDEDVNGVGDGRNSPIDFNDSVNDRIKNLSKSQRCRIFHFIINSVLDILDANNITLQFSREALKYFLVSHSRLLKPSDFADTNTITKNDRRVGKHTMHLMNGAILNEYGKNPEIFIASLGRSDDNDVDAIKFIVQHGIILDPKIYNVCTKINVQTQKYKPDINYTPRNDYSMILISNFKQTPVLVTRNIIMVYDGNQFILPPSNVERDFTSLVLSSSKLQNDDYILLDVIISTKSKVIDILEYKIGDLHELPQEYNKRLELIVEYLPTCKVATISNQNHYTDVSYIQKPNVGFGDSYIYTKSNITAAAIGIEEKNIVLAFLSDNNNLVVKQRVTLASPVSYTMIMAPTQTNTNNNENCLNNDGAIANNEDSNKNNTNIPREVNAPPTIKYNNEVYNIIGDVENTTLFENIIPVELRDCNKIPNLSRRPISNVSEYKPVQVNKDLTTLDLFKRQIDTNPDLINAFLQALTANPFAISQETKHILRSVIEVDTNHIDFTGYK